MKKHQRLGLKGYASILIKLKGGDYSAYQLAEAMDSRADTFIPILKRFHIEDLIHIVSWTRNEGVDKGLMIPVYGFGSGEDFPYPGIATQRKDCPRNTVTATLLSFCHLVNAMREPSCVWESYAQSGMGIGACRRVVRQLHKARVIHVARWLTRDSWPGPPMPYYQLGDKKNAPKPRPKPRERSTCLADRKYQGKKKANLTIDSAHKYTGGYSIFSAAMVPA